MTNTENKNWKLYGVIKKGWFSETGWPSGWYLSTNLINNQPILTICDNGDVLLAGEYSEELTTERKNSLGLVGYDDYMRQKFFDKKEKE